MNFESAFKACEAIKADWDIEIGHSAKLTESIAGFAIGWYVMLLPANHNMQCGWPLVYARNLDDLPDAIYKAVLEVTK